MTFSFTFWSNSVLRRLPRVKSLSPIFVLTKSHTGQALLQTKIDADYAVWPTECTVPNTRSASVYWLIATVSLISIQNQRQISSCINCFPNRQVLVSYKNHFSSLGILNKVTNSSLLYLGTNKNIESLIRKKSKMRQFPMLPCGNNCQISQKQML